MKIIIVIHPQYLSKWKDRTSWERTSKIRQWNSNFFSFVILYVHVTHIFSLSKVSSVNLLRVMLSNGLKIVLMGVTRPTLILWQIKEWGLGKAPEFPKCSPNLMMFQFQQLEMREHHAVVLSWPELYREWLFLSREMISILSSDDIYICSTSLASNWQPICLQSEMYSQMDLHLLSDKTVEPSILQ